MTVVRSHYSENSKVPERERIYRAGNAIAEWVGLDSWVDIPLMQYPDRVEKFHRMIQEAS